MRFDRKTPQWGVFALAALFGALIWALSPAISGRAEPWDADSAYYLFALPVAGFVAGWLAGGPLWAQYAGVILGQFVYGLVFVGVGPLMLLGVAFLAAYGLLYLAGTLGGLRLRRAMAVPEGAPRTHLRVIGGRDNGLWLERYDGQSTEELLKLSRTHRAESLALAFSDALSEQGVTRPLNREESLVLLAVRFGRETASGGYAQWLHNASRDEALDTVSALRALDCPKAADLTQEAVDVVGADRLRDPLSLDLRLNDLSVRRHLQECDGILAGNDEVLAARLLHWIAERPESIILRTLQ